MDLVLPLKPCIPNKVQIPLKGLKAVLVWRDFKYTVVISDFGASCLSFVCNSENNVNPKYDLASSEVTGTSILFTSVTYDDITFLGGLIILETQ